MLPSSGLSTTKSRGGMFRRADVLVDDRARRAGDRRGCRRSPGSGRRAGRGPARGRRRPTVSRLATSLAVIGTRPDVLAVLAGVAVVGQHGGDAGGAGPLEAVQHDQQFHQVLVDRRAGRLDDEDVAAAHVLLDADRDFAVGEVVEGDLAERRRRGHGRSSRARGMLARPLKTLSLLLLFMAAHPGTEGIVHGERALSGRGKAAVNEKMSQEFVR